MPGFFDLIFRASKPEPEAPKPKKVKKAKKSNKRFMKKEDSVIDSLRAEISELREMVTPPEPEPEPEIVTEEPDDDESS